MSAKTASIDPGKSKEITFTVQSYKAKGSKYECEGK